MDFYRKIGIVCRMIPRGRVATYGQIAALCGKRRNARQVGYALKLGLAGDIPAHRVVNSRGELVGAKYFETPTKQMQLLRDEGVEFITDGEGWRVRMSEFAWRLTDPEFDAVAAVEEEE